MDPSAREAILRTPHKGDVWNQSIGMPISGAASRGLTTKWQGNHIAAGTHVVPARRFCHSLDATQQVAGSAGFIG